MTMVNREGKPDAASPRKRGRPARPPCTRNCAIYERVRLDGESQEKVAADYAVSRQRIAVIVAQVESWIASHAAHELAQKMRARCGKRWEMLWAEAMTCFARSREDREIKKQRTRSAAAGEVVTTITELTSRQQNGDPRFLHIARRVAEREDRLWMKEDVQDNGEHRQPYPDGGAVMDHVSNVSEPASENGTAPVLDRVAAMFPYLPAGLCDLQHLACGLSRDELTPVSTRFEQRCAEAFRCLGFDVRELGQGCGRVADSLAVAPSERFAVIIDAKVRRRGYTLGTDDRQFCEYATRHARELALSGIERVYFAVVGHGFRQDDLDKLAGFMSGTPIRSVVFIEAEAVMRMVNDSIARRREFRLADIDRLLFGNKVIEA